MYRPAVVTLHFTETIDRLADDVEHAAQHFLTNINWDGCAFRNSLLPIITVFANIFPAAIGGSVILESIFTIPGMGSEAIFAIQNNNYPMIIAILTITGFLTLVGYLISDILYALVDPRISYK